MSSVDVTVYKSIRMYPDMFPNRTAVLHHVLCVLGGGYVWVNGEPIDAYDEEEGLGVFTREEHDKQLDLYPARFLADAEFMKEHENSWHRLSEIVEAASERVHLRGDIGENFYPQSSHAPIMEIPENITPDWAAAVEEMKAVAVQHGWKF